MHVSIREHLLTCHRRAEAGHTCGQRFSFHLGNDQFEGGRASPIVATAYAATIFVQWTSGKRVTIARIFDDVGGECTIWVEMFVRDTLYVACELTD